MFDSQISAFGEMGIRKIHFLIKKQKERKIIEEMEERGAWLKNPISKDDETKGKERECKLRNLDSKREKGLGESQYLSLPLLLRLQKKLF